MIRHDSAGRNLLDEHDICLCSDRYSHSRGLRHRHSMGRARSVHIGAGSREIRVRPGRIRQKGRTLLIAELRAMAQLDESYARGEVRRGRCQGGLHNSIHLLVRDCSFFQCNFSSTGIRLTRGQIRTIPCLGNKFLRVVHFNSETKGVSSEAYGNFRSGIRRWDSGNYEQGLHTTWLHNAISACQIIDSSYNRLWPSMTGGTSAILKQSG